ncbi:MAG: hypothetical protein JJE52_06270 [Acidimicrobiia bacterium]|nr:hypothetical protein [Acidimicrobiia bacterium]
MDIGVSLSRHPHLAASPWPAEDGGPRRQQRPHSIVGPQAARAELAASRLAPLSIMALLTSDERVLVLRKGVGPDEPSWVEEIDPDSLEERQRSIDLAVGPFWPGGMAVLADGAIVVVQGRWAHRLRPDLTVERSRELPVDAPYNSFVVLDDGLLATKDLQRPDGPPSTLSILDPLTLDDRVEPYALSEPCVARLAADGNEIVVVGTTGLHRIHWDPTSGQLGPAAPSFTYLDDAERSFGWDPLVDAGAIWWMDGGDHTFAAGMTMLGNGVASGANRLWKLPLDGAPPAWVEISGQPGGAVTNPPIVDPERGLVIAYDSANGVAAAFDIADLTMRWRIELATAQHLVLYADTGELVADDHDPELGDSLVVIDVATGTVRARVVVDSPAQSVVFGAPGTRRDFYFVSLSTIARVTFHDT